MPGSHPVWQLDGNLLFEVTGIFDNCTTPPLCRTYNTTINIENCTIMQICATNQSELRTINFSFGEKLFQLSVRVFGLLIKLLLCFVWYIVLSYILLTILVSVFKLIVLSIYFNV